jgi:hypothetical protein
MAAERRLFGSTSDAGGGTRKTPWRPPGFLRRHPMPSVLPEVPSWVHIRVHKGGSVRSAEARPKPSPLQRLHPPAKPPPRRPPKASSLSGGADPLTYPRARSSTAPGVVRPRGIQGRASAERQQRKAEQAGVRRRRYSRNKRRLAALPGDTKSGQGGLVPWNEHGRSDGGRIDALIEPNRRGASFSTARRLSRASRTVSPVRSRPTSGSTSATARAPVELDDAPPGTLRLWINVRNIEDAEQDYVDDTLSVHFEDETTYEMRPA